ncbi:hypothetical protein C6361_29235 [Plantactinospora sp. BC1]|uniref:hypothetical protein n=1 Tax=Plantactinospora sp. BC1 TaxID=2108470 RepID=UPI000D15DD97|nr:hypothetical protein [Plantactinospora sp. BC1]AVT32874.1 hypothetical protein C6361_29235 [Plantactinospora sp. BC1]
MSKGIAVVPGAAGGRADRARRSALRRRIRETLALRRADAAAGLRAGPGGAPVGPAGDTGQGAVT